MSASKSNYPERPLGGKRPSRPGEQRKKPSQTSGGGRRKTWMSLRDKTEGDKRDVSTPLNFPWWKSPMFKEARRQKWAA